MISDKDSDLKPCPFCGGEAEYKECSGNYGYTPDCCYVHCSKCEIEQKPMDREVHIDNTVGHVRRDKEAKQAVIKRWNTRAPNTVTFEIPDVEKNGGCNRLCPAFARNTRIRDCIKKFGKMVNGDIKPGPGCPRFKGDE